jgi:hypothetical protein
MVRKKGRLVVLLVVWWEFENKKKEKMFFQGWYCCFRPFQINENNSELLGLFSTKLPSQRV